jgi:response regulator RpfG family c-di-GMP phosphodiesterase
VALRKQTHGADQGKVTILVVDDEASILELLGEYLRARGHKVYTAPDGERALELLNSASPDVVLTDMKMPGMSGLQLLAQIRSRPVPIATILMTGYGTVDSAIRSMKNGAHDYLLKPFKLREVHAAITRAVEQVRMERETVRLQQVVALYKAVHGLENASGLQDIYTLLCDLAEREFGGSAALLAFDEPDAEQWIEFHRTHSESFRGLNLQALAERMLQGKTREHCWFDENQSVLLTAPIRAQTSADEPTRIVGLVAVEDAQLNSSEAAQALEVYGSIVGDALSRQILASRLRFSETGQDARLGGSATHTPKAHAQRVSDLVTRAATAVSLSQEQIQLAGVAARFHDYNRLGISLADLISGRPLEDGFTADQGVDASQFAELAPILADLLEHFDGFGSPRGRSGDAIHPIAQLLAVADRWDMLTATRAYAPLMSPSEAAAALRTQSGSVFRSDVVESFIEVVGEAPDRT